MDYSREALDSSKYLTLKGALASTDLTAPELKRAIALGFVTTAEIGTATFVERRSLEMYASANRSIVAAFSGAGPIASSFISGGLGIDEDNYTNPQERAVFRKALERDRGTVSSLSVAPYISVGVLALLALILSFPVPQGPDSGVLGEAEAFFTRANLKEATLDRVNALLTYTSEAGENVAQTLERGEADSTRGYMLTPELQRASAISSLLGSISEAVDSLALRVYESLNSLIRGES